MCWKKLNPAFLLATAGLLLGTDPGHGIGQDQKAFLPLAPDLYLFPGNGELSASYDEHTVVRQLYEAAAQRLRDAGFAMELETRELRTYYHFELGSLSVSQVLAPGQIRLEVGLEEHFELGLGSEPRSLRQGLSLRWQSTSRQAPPGAELVPLPGALAILSALAPELASVRAITTFHVRLVVEGKSESYRASVLWVRRDSGPALLSIQDNVLPALPQLVSLPVPQREAPSGGAPGQRSKSKSPSHSRGGTSISQAVLDLDLCAELNASQNEVPLAHSWRRTVFQHAVVTQRPQASNEDKHRARPPRHAP